MARQRALSNPSSHPAHPNHARASARSEWRALALALVHRTGSCHHGFALCAACRGSLRPPPTVGNPLLIYSVPRYGMHANVSPHQVVPPTPTALKSNKLDLILIHTHTMDQSTRRDANCNGNGSNTPKPQWTMEGDAPNKLNLGLGLLDLSLIHI